MKYRFKKQEWVRVELIPMYELMAKLPESLTEVQKEAIEQQFREGIPEKWLDKVSEDEPMSAEEYVKGKVWDNTECYALNGDMYKEILICTFNAGAAENDKKYKPLIDLCNGDVIRSLYSILPSLESNRIYKEFTDLLKKLK